MPPNEICLEARLGPADATTALDQGEAAEDRRHGAVPVPKPMLPELRKLDRGEDRAAARPGGQRVPGFRGFVIPAEPSKEMGAIAGDPIGRPGRIERGRPR